MNSDGTNVRQLTKHPAADAEPAWSPDGKKIAFISTRDAGENRWDIYVMDADGKNVRRLTNDGAASNPAWSPDGRQIVFDSYRDRNGEIYMMDADGEISVT